MLYALPRERLDSWLKNLSRKFELFVPVSEEGFGPYKGRLYLEGKTRLSTKEFFLPWREPYLRFEARPGAFPEPIEIQNKERVIFGVRPCDAKGITLIEKVFAEDGPFRKRREKTFLIGLMCREPGSQCFGWAMGLDPYAGEGLDLLVIERSSSWLVQEINPRGRILLDDSFQEASEEEARALEAEREAFHHKYAVSPALEKLKNVTLLKLYEAPFWEELALPCINCGTCTFLCPTCYCFDVQDEVVGEKGVRLRLPDACMFELYSRHASGHNPRRSPVARFRNRFLHKFKYFLDSYGEPLCVGCGRCIEECPAGVNLWDVIRAMSEV